MVSLRPEIGAKKDPQRLLLAPNAKMKEAIERLGTSRHSIVFTMDEDGRVTGCITDGDVRRAFLRGETLDSPVRGIARQSFIRAPIGTSIAKIKEILVKNGIRQVPILDDQGRLVEVYGVDTFVHESADLGLPAVIMAGGKGTRLRPITESVPKPLVRVGDQTLVERLISGLSGKGVKRFHLSVNYLAEQVMEHLGDGSRFSCEISYVREEEPLGTAGSLRLLKDAIGESDFFVFNCDVLTTVDLPMLYEFHREHRAAATVCTKLHSIKVPYGVVKTSGSDFVGIDEKPDLALTVNSGIYVLSARIFELLRQNEAIDMPDLLCRATKEGLPIRCFQSMEPWIDIGTMVELEKAKIYLDHLST